LDETPIVDRLAVKQRRWRNSMKLIVTTDYLQVRCQNREMVQSCCASGNAKIKVKFRIPGEVTTIAESYAIADAGIVMPGRRKQPDVPWPLRKNRSVCSIYLYHKRE
jgi:hypothetical protein